MLSALASFCIPFDFLGNFYLLMSAASSTLIYPTVVPMKLIEDTFWYMN